MELTKKNIHVTFPCCYAAVSKFKMPLRSFSYLLRGVFFICTVAQFIDPKPGAASPPLPPTAIDNQVCQGGYYPRG